MFNSHKIWWYFQEISKIYRESGHNEEISNYIAKTLAKNDFSIEKKPDGTICATRGLNEQKNNAIILQAHMDMVGISGDGNSKKPIELMEKDGWLMANDRTLGADDGIGVAAILALAEDKRFYKKPLQAIITTDEETSMKGAKKLQPEDFCGKYLINLDSEEYGVIIKGCAGISEYHIDEKYTETFDDEDYQLVTIKMSGANGGHSACISNNSLHPIKEMLKLINKKDIKIVEIVGGERVNAIPRDTTAKILIQDEKFITELETKLKEIKKLKQNTNPEFIYEIFSEKAIKKIKYFDENFQENFKKYMNILPIGLFSQFADSSNKTSQNLGVINISKGYFHVEIMGRSSDTKEGEDLRAKTLKTLSEMFGYTINVTTISPIWEPKDKAHLEEITAKSFEEINDQKPTIRVEHGGLEAAVFAKLQPQMEQVSIGPTLETPHSTKERLKIDTVIPFYNWLAKILEKL